MVKGARFVFPPTGHDAFDVNRERVQIHADHHASRQALPHPDTARLGLQERRLQKLGRVTTFGVVPIEPESATQILRLVWRVDIDRLSCELARSLAQAHTAHTAHTARTRARARTHAKMVPYLGVHRAGGRSAPWAVKNKTVRTKTGGHLNL